MASKEVYRIVTAEGHEYDYHGTVAQLKEAHPGAVITGRRTVSAVGEGTYEPYSIAKAQAAETAADEAEKPVRYKDMKVDDLRAVLDERGILIPEGVKKADLIAALEAHDNGEDALWEVSSEDASDEPEGEKATS